LPDVRCANNVADFPTVVKSADAGGPFQFVPCNCHLVESTQGDTLAHAIETQCRPGNNLRQQYFRCGPYDMVGSFGADYGGIEFYDRSTGTPVGSFNYGRRDTCEAYDRAFTGLPTPCVELPFPCLDAGSSAGD
jgi:hypothetical protein